MLEASKNAALAWTGAELSKSDAWINQLSPAEIGEILSAVDKTEKKGLKLFDIRAEDFPLPTLGSRLAGLSHELEGGRGFAVLRGIPVDQLSLESNQRIIWGLGQHLGTPEPQDRIGSLLHDVRNTGKQVVGSDSTRGYETDDELTFHNDGGDAFMLLCLKTAVQGGISKLVSATTLFEEVRKRRPDLLPTFQEPFFFDLRSQSNEGLKVQGVPIFTPYQGHLNVLYKRRFIVQAQRFEDVPRLSAQQLEALDLLDEICADPAVHLAFTMQRGDIQVGNNHAILHSRTSYVDAEEATQRRHLLRLWLTLPNGRPLPPAYANTREFGHTYERRMRPSASH